MDDFYTELGKSLQTGFVDRSIHSKKEYCPSLLTNNKKTGRKILTTINKHLLKCDEFWFSVAFVTTSGVSTLINTLEELEKKGVKGKLLVSQYLNFTQPEALRKLLKFKNIELKIAVNGDFHSKGYLFKRAELYDLIIGSSNLTASALCSNKEWNLKVSALTNSDLICHTLNEFESEFGLAVSVNQDLISSYESIYNKKYEYDKKFNSHVDDFKKIAPNQMQQDALRNIDKIRLDGKSKALLISATGTGEDLLVGL